MGWLDDTLDMISQSDAFKNIQEREKQVGDRFNKMVSDVGTIAQPGMMHDLGGFLTDKAEQASDALMQYPGGGRPESGKTPFMDFLINGVVNLGKMATSSFDPENPVGSVAMGPAGALEKGGEALELLSPAEKATRLAQAGKEGTMLAESTKGIQEGRFIGQRFDPIQGITRPKLPPSADISGIANKADIVAPVSPASVKIKNFLNSGEADRELDSGEMTKAIIRGEKGKQDLATFRQAGEDSWTRAKQGVRNFLGMSGDDVETGHLMEQMGKWYGRPMEDRLQMIRRVESNPTHLGEMPEITNPEDQALAFELGQGQFERESKIAELSDRDGTDYMGTYLKSYMSHTFDDANKASDLFDRYITNKKISQGASYTPPTAQELIDHGLENGLKLRTYNPIEFSLMRNVDMDKFLLGQNVKDKLIEEGLAMERVPEKGATQVPDNWVRLDPSMTGGKAFFATPDSAKYFNRYFAPGLSGNSVFDTIRGFNTGLNQAQLGFSGFHGLFTGINAFFSDLALAGEQAVGGKFAQAGKTFLAAPLAPFSNAVAGGRVLREALTPGAYGQYVREVEAMAQAGGRPTIDPIYLNNSLNRWKEAVGDGNWAKAAGRSIPAALEQISKPLMEWYVPRVKLGAFQKLAANVLEDAQKMGLSELQTNAALQGAWNSIDNRFGQLVYNNLFWNKAWKDVALVGVRSLGWQLGTAREVGGGLLDLGKQTGRLLAEGKFSLSHRMAYTGAMFMGSAMLGGLTHYFMTGQMPNSIRDYFFPGDGTFDQNGNMNRINFPSYVKDVVNIVNHPARSAVNKLSPVINSAVDIMQNRNFEHVEIRHPGDPLASQTTDIAKYLADELTPFSLRNYRNRANMEGGNALSNAIQTFVGVNPAPRDLVRTPAQNMAADFISKQLDQRTYTKEEAARREARNALENSYRRGTVGVRQLIEATGKGQISKQQMNNMIKYRNLPILSRQVQQLKPEEAYQVYKAGNPQEQKLIESSVRRQIFNQMKRSMGDPIERKKWSDMLLSMPGKIATPQEDTIRPTDY